MQLLSLLAGLLLCSGLSAGQTPILVTDLNALGSAASSAPDGAVEAVNSHGESQFIEFSGSWYFTAQTLGLGRELWRTDGVTVELFAELTPGLQGSDINWLTVHGNWLWFSASLGGVNHELWVSDGTLAGTQMVKEIFPAPTGSSLPQFIVGLGGKVYFGATNGTAGRELWVSDGTVSGTKMVLDIRPGSLGSDPRQIVLDPSGQKLIFQANDGVHGVELWESDGTAAGTKLLKDINSSGGFGSSPGSSGMLTWQGSVYFSAFASGLGTELWRTDGTASGTALVADIEPGSGSSQPDLRFFAELNGELFFSARGPSGRELYKTDGTAAGTLAVSDINLSGDSDPSDMTAYKGRLYFTATDMLTVGRELWSTDGSAAPTLEADLEPGNGAGFKLEGNHLTVWKDALFMLATAGNANFELWTISAAGASPTLVKDLEPGPVGSTPDWLTPLSSSQMLFVAETTTDGRELFMTDGTAAGTSLFADLDAGQLTGDANPRDLHPVAGSFFLFHADDGVLGDELYRWDAAGGVVLLADINSGPDSSGIEGLTTAYLQGELLTFFRADNGDDGAELWATDGTAAGTRQLKDISPGVAGSSPSALYFHAGHGAVYFRADDGASGTELWRTDGTSAGTTLVADLYPGSSPGTFGNPYSSSPAELIEIGPWLVFRATDGVHGTELFRSDGTASGTGLLTDLDPGSTTGGNPLNGFPHEFVEYQGRLLFAAREPGVGTELFETDGTAAGTGLLVDISPGSTGSIPSELTVFDGAVYFQASDGSLGWELWKTDGTAAGTLLVADIFPGSPSGDPTDLTATSGALFFAARGSNSVGRELWRSNGLASGTQLVADIDPGFGDSSEPSDFVPAGVGAFFQAKADSGSELYYSDGTVAGTTLVADLMPGLAAGAPSDLSLADGHLFFAAAMPYPGRELLTIAAPGAYVQDLGGGAGGVQLAAEVPLLGATVSVTIEGVPLGTLTGLFASFGVDAPVSSTLLDTASASWIDPSTALLLGVVPSSPGSGVISFTIPVLPSLAGLQLHLQAWLAPLGAVRASTSNGLQLVLGN